MAYAALARSPEEDHEDCARRVARSLLPLVLRRKLARNVSICCAPEAFPIPAVRRYVAAARDLGFRVKIHAQRRACDDSVGLAVEMGAAVMACLEHVSDADIDLLAESPIIASLAPGAAFAMGLDRFAPARSMIDRGVAVSLASAFNIEESPSYSMPFVLALACTRMGMTAAEALVASTINAAYAAGCGAETGSLEPGKRADLIVLNARDYHEISYHAGVNPVYLTLKNGRVIYRQGAVDAKAAAQ